MKEDDNLFFKKVTTAICSSIDIATSLHRSLLLLKNRIPLDMMIVWIYDENYGGLRKIAMATKERGHNSDDIMELPPAARKKLLNMDIPHTIMERTGLSPVVMRIVNQPDSDPMAKSLKKHFEPQNYSSMVMYLDCEGKRLGTLFVRCEGINKYDSSHARLLSMFLEPFALATANALHQEEMKKAKNVLISENRSQYKDVITLTGEKIIGAEYGLKNVIDMASQVAILGSPVLLRGETGTGKDIIANAIHQLSAFKDGPFIKVNCGAIPESLIDAELFGHEKGAFTGALFQKRGYFERADNGTIFLDEIGELPLQIQVRLLRVLQFKEIQRVGGSDPIKINIRIIAATHRNLEEMVTSKLFRDDLWFRLNVFPIFIPPLRHRKDDIQELVSHMIIKKSRELNLTRIPTVSSSALKKLRDYEWPGNVRELENVIERALILSRSETINLDAIFPNEISTCVKTATSSKSIASIDELLSEHIRATLLKCSGKVQGRGGAAELLKINASTLRNMMKRLAIQYGRKTKFSSNSCNK